MKYWHADKNTRWRFETWSHKNNAEQTIDSNAEQKIDSLHLV
jgi:hypothetical protein